jgi:NADH-quinone oxidoreductase subunit L
MVKLLWLIPFAPFLGAAATGFGGRYLPRRAAAAIACGSVGVAFLLSIAAALEIGGRRVIVHVADWFTVGGAGGLNASWRLLLDPLSAVMILVVTGVGLLIHIYSIGYMAGEKAGYARYFAFLNLFTGMMLLLVLGADLPVIFVGWEGVGLCSYLLIGFYYTEEWCADAGRKAFLVNRIGDAGFLLGALTLWTATGGSMQVESLLSGASSGALSRDTALAASLLLFAGAVGKSAQIPLYVWLPDAMAGPTPVSALIHAATMVTAGVYLVVRLGAVFLIHPLALSVVAGIGAATAVYAATIACAQTDIKKVLAYSTVSQLGYMFMGVGVGAFSAAIFHLVTHAFFKAALFLGAGSVIHALGGEQEMERMGGLRERLLVTYGCMLAAAMSIAGAPLFAGFFSKDEILWHALSGGHMLVWIAGLAGAGMTAFYVFRMIFLVFWGNPRDAALAKHAHEAPRVMAAPLAILGALSVIGGLIGVPAALSLGGDWNWIARWLAPALPAAPHGPAHGALSELGAAGLSVLVAGAGFGLAWAIYEGREEWATRIQERLAPLAAWARAAYSVDDLYARWILQPLAALCRAARALDAVAVDGAVNALGRAVDLAGHFGRYMQTGLVRNYALFLLIGAVLLLYWVLP